MATQCSFVPCVDGIWTQLCEHRDTRQSLMVQLLGGSCVLGITTNAPNATTTIGVIPVGVFHSTVSGLGPNAFRLSLRDDGDLVKQVWYCWPVPGSNPVPPATLTSFVGGVTDAGLLTFNLPSGVTSIVDGFVWGNGGSGGLPLVALGASGGGGGAFASTGPQTSSSYQYANGIVTPNFIKDALTGTTLASAGFGGPGVSPVGGVAGVATVGAVQHNGGAGDSSAALAGAGSGAGGAGGFVAVGNPGVGRIGGLGGGAATYLGYGAGGNGSDGAIVGGICNNGFAPGGGGAGVGKQGAGGSQVPRTGGRGAVLFFYNLGGPLSIWIPNVAVFESYSVEALDNPDYVEPNASITVNLPKLSRGGVAALQDLLSRLGRGRSDGACQSSTGET